MKKGMLIAGMAVGGLLTLGPLWGILGTVLGMTSAFDHLQSNGVNSPQVVAHDVGLTLLSTVTGVFLCPLGIAMFVLSLLFFLRDERSAKPLLHHHPSR